MGFNDKFALQKILNGPCLLWVLLFSNSGRALASITADLRRLQCELIEGRPFD
jgi:hypothetical protein